MIRKPRAPRPTRRMGTEVHADGRTNRRRTRSDDERAHLEEELATIEESRYFLYANGVEAGDEPEDPT